MDSDCKVSVIIPVRNGEKFITETLRSISRQSFAQFEVIVVDDGSTDNTRSIVEEFTRHDNRFQLVSNPLTPGHEHARNYGVSLATSNWIAECDADDTWKHEKLSKQMTFVSHWCETEPLVAIGTAGDITNQLGEMVSHLDGSPSSYDEFLVMRARHEAIMLHHSSVLYSREVFAELGGYDADYMGAEDTELFTRMSEKGAIICLPDRLFCYRKHTGSFSLANTTAQLYNLMRVQENARRRHANLQTLDYDEFVQSVMQKMTSKEKRVFQNQIRGKHLYRIGAISAANKRYLKGAWYLASACMYDRSIVLSGIKRRIADSVSR